MKLFDGRLCDQIMGMNRHSLARYLESNIESLRRKEKDGGWVHNSVFHEIEEHGGSVANAVHELLKRGETVEELKVEAVLDFALGEERLYLDYWGCSAHVFNVGDMEGGTYFPDNETGEGSYLLLDPGQVSRMIESLREHIDDLPVMGAEGVKKLEAYRDYCLTHPGYVVAYEFDI